MSIKEAATQNIKDIKKVLDDLNILFWLDGGTLLGAYRDKDFCEGDEDDMDLGLWIESKDKRISDNLIGIGFEIHNLWDSEWSFVRNGSKVDLLLYHKKGEDAYTFLYDAKGGIPMVGPARFYEDLDTIEFKGEIFNKPKDTEGYMEVRYGKDWRTPIHRRDYSCYNGQQNKMLKPDYETN